MRNQIQKLHNPNAYHNETQNKELCLLRSEWRSIAPNFATMSLVCISHRWPPLSLSQAPQCSLSQLQLISNSFFYWDWNFFFKIFIILFFILYLSHWIYPTTTIVAVEVAVETFAAEDPIRFRSDAALPPPWCIPDPVPPSRFNLSFSCLFIWFSLLFFWSRFFFGQEWFSLLELYVFVGNLMFIY